MYSSASLPAGGARKLINAIRKETRAMNEVRLPQGAALPKANACQPVIADTSAPQNIIEVEYQALASAAPAGSHDTHHQIAISRPRQRRNLR